MRKRILLILIAAVLFSGASSVRAVPPIPFRIGGTLTINGETLTPLNDSGYVISVTYQNSQPPYSATTIAVDDDGLSGQGTYIIDIPTYDATEQPGGMQPGETVVLHVFQGDEELMITSPAGGLVMVGEMGSTMQVDITAWSPDENRSQLYTPAEVDAMISQAVEDALLSECKVLRSDGNVKIGLEQAIRALQIVSGF